MLNEPDGAELDGEPHGYQPKVGDIVVVRPEHRHRFHESSRAARGEPLGILGPNGEGWSIGPNPADLVYAFEVDQLAAAEEIAMSRPDTEGSR